jgi:hypothetical protein
VPADPPEHAAELAPDTGFAPSAIAGRGLVATAPITRATIVVRFAVAPSSVPALGPVNHSCDPSLGWVDATTLVALHEVGAGAELTVDYATAIDDSDFTLWCHCGSYRCRQVIEGSDWQIPQLRARYAGRWTPRLQHRIETIGR